MKMGERNFETPNLGGDLWSMGFDVDLALDAHSSRKNSVGMNSVGGSSSSPMGNGGVNIGYGDMQHMLLHRFEDDLNDGDISQITDLTNSLPKGDAETAHSFLAKIACHDLTRELGGAQGPPVPKSIEASLFGGVNDGGGQGSNVLSHKLPSHPVDVYGRVTLFEGKLVLQLRHFNANTNYPINVGECWLCRERMSNGSQIHSHKHVLQGLFQVNDEFVQMDIDHYIIPEQALEPDPADVNRNLTPAAMIAAAPGHSAMAQHVTENRTLTLAEDMECSEALQSSHVNMNTIGNALHTPQRTLETGNESLQTPKGSSEIQYTETDLNNALSSAQQSLNGAVPIDSQAFLNPFSNTELRIGPEPGPAIVVTQDDSMMSHTANTTDPSASFSAPPPPLPSCVIANTNNHNATASAENMISAASCTGAHSTLNEMENIDALCSSSTSMTPSKNDGFSQHTTYEPNISTSKEHLDNYHNFFGPQYSYSYDNSSINSHLPKFHIDSQASSAGHPCPPLPLSNRRTEVGAKKRKSRAQKKPSSIRMKEERDDAFDTPHLVDKKAETIDYKVSSTSPGNCQSRETSAPSVQAKENTAKEIEKVTSPPVVTDRAELKVPPEISNVFVSKAHLSPPKTDFTMQCPFCRLEFDSKNITAFNNHVKIHKFEPSHMFKCPFCFKTIQSLDKYMRHLKIHSEKRHFCSKCDAHYSRRDKLQRHIDNVHDCQKPFVCEVCSKSFSRHDYLKAHKNIHSGKKLECDICHQLFSSQFNLKAHKKLHTNEKLPFPCEFCEKTFSRKDFLSSHVARDHKNKRFKCDICCKLFSRNDVLKRHKVTHDEERITYDCEVCGKKFRRKDRLKAHSYDHKDPKGESKESKGRLKGKDILLKQLKVQKSRQQCGICFKYLPSTLRFQKHLRWHETHETQIALKVNLEKDYLKKNHKCHLCSKSFKTEEVLRRHTFKSHYNNSEESSSKGSEIKGITEKRFFCEVCSKTFTRSYNLKTHLKTHSKAINSQCEDDQVLAELPTVLNASKSTLKRRKRSYLTLTKDGGTASTSLSHPTLYSSSKEQLSSPPTTAGFHLPLEEGYVPITSNNSSYNSHLPPHLSSELPIPTSSFCSSSPSSPINLSTEAISAAAYLLAHPFYEGPYQ